MSGQWRTSSKCGRIRARTAAFFFGTVVTVTDLIPPHFRYGYVHRLTRRLFQRHLPTLAAVGRAPSAPSPSNVASGDATLTCALLTGSMDVGGIGTVVEMLATALPTVGIRTVVVCTDDGVRAARIRARGVEVVVIGASAAEQTLAELGPDVVAMHGAPEPLETAAVSSGIPLVPVLHNTEIHYTRARWRRFAQVLIASAAAIAVSDLVREFHAGHVSNAPVERIHVVANAVPTQAPPTDDERRAARRALSTTLHTDLDGDVVFVCLARYDSQKNVAGLVSSFLSSATDPRARLVVAGDPSDWAEWRRADAIRRCSPDADRVSLLSTSDARTLLAAADAFILDSFFEGWPVAATEAAAMGLPLVLSDFGGARELVDREPVASVLISNACGSAETVSDAAVARARRRCRHQSNAAELGSAIDGLIVRALSGARRAPAPTQELMNAMIEGHAAVLRQAAASARDDAVVEIDRVERRRP